ncbi:MAG: tryptophan synthase subunit alpha, partial [Acidobacteria bacterium]|nr:tryptophan synthase subunit alpha [Acidobacteriota bacterium]
KRFEELRQRQELGLVAYITAGDPDLRATAEFIPALEEAGVDVLELGVPFSDPLADGPVIQRASQRALASGTTLAGVLEMAAQARGRSRLPLLLFSYLNPILRYGFDRFAADARRAGIDGVLITDLSIEEADAYIGRMRQAELDTVFLAAPTSTEARLRRICEVSRGFVYAVSRTGVTGTQQALSGQLLPLLQRLRAASSLPVAAGFGISRPEHIRELRGHADAAVVGSALVRVVEEHRSAERLAALAAELKQAGRGVQGPGSKVQGRVDANS